MRDDSELFILSLVAAQDWISTEEIKKSLNTALNNRDRNRRLRFGLPDLISETLMSFAAHGWIEARLPPGDPNHGEWKVSEIGRQVLAQAPADLYERLGFQSAVGKP